LLFLGLVDQALDARQITTLLGRQVPGQLLLESLGDIQCDG